MRKQKEGCARIVIWDEFKIDLAYTMEATYSGFDLGIYKVGFRTAVYVDRSHTHEMIFKGLQIQMSTLQIIGHNFCQVLLKLADQELRTAEIVVPFEDLFVTNRAYARDKW